jgi:YVTN family beta-propeller protein
VSVISTRTNTVVDTVRLSSAVPIDNGPNGLAITPDGLQAYVTNTFSNDVSVISPLTNTVITTIPAGMGPSDVDIARIVRPVRAGRPALPPAIASNSNQQVAGGAVTSRSRSRHVTRNEGMNHKRVRRFSGSGGPLR